MTTIKMKIEFNKSMDKEQQYRTVIDLLERVLKAKITFIELNTFSSEHPSTKFSYNSTKPLEDSIKPEYDISIHAIIKNASNNDPVYRYLLTKLFSERLILHDKKSYQGEIRDMTNNSSLAFYKTLLEGNEFRNFMKSNIEKINAIILTDGKQQLIFQPSEL